MILQVKAFVRFRMLVLENPRKELNIRTNRFGQAARLYLCNVEVNSWMYDSMDDSDIPSTL